MAPDDEDVTNNNLKAATKRKLYFVYVRFPLAFPPKLTFTFDSGNCKF